MFMEIQIAWNMRSKKICPRTKIQIEQIPTDAISSNNDTHDQLEYERNLHAEIFPSHTKLSIAQIPIENVNRNS